MFTPNSHDELEKAIRDRDRKIDKNAAELVRQGVAPWAAMEKASRDYRYTPPDEQESPK